jgi:hypothetical protein
MPRLFKKGCKAPFKRPTKRLTGTLPAHDTLFVVRTTHCLLLISVAVFLLIFKT